MKRSIATIKAYEMEPFIAVGEFIKDDGAVEPAPIEDTLDFCFGEVRPDGVFIGFMRDTDQVTSVAARIRSEKPAIVVSDPSIISDKGEIWMTEDTYNVISTSIFDMSSHIIINHLEAELLAGFECQDRMDFERAAKKLQYAFDANIYIKSCDLTSGKSVYCDATGVTWIDEEPAGINRDYSFGNALNCELALGAKGLKAVTNALYFVHNGRRVSDSIPVPQVAPSLISPAKSLRDIARSMDTEASSVSAKPAKTSIIDPVTAGVKGTSTEIKAPEKAPARSVSDSLSELADIKKRLEALKKSSM
ncbi:MAG: bifunctional hydroxymethylpyrimidine kinase/phosphomethylpyrimidine kinase [Clostridiales bacterium]|nr:bifunctional hydroxymethylpyrimidine kinase/phosphomethylpyrimidine kinase [Clostridiales bacterium]